MEKLELGHWALSRGMKSVPSRGSGWVSRLRIVDYELDR